MGRRIAFFGTPDFALTVLNALIKSEHSVVAVVTQPDRRAGRGRHKQASAVKEGALAHGVSVYQPPHLKDDPLKEMFESCQPDLCVVVAYGLIIPADLLSRPQYGFVNVHASLLPIWRGAAPIQRALMAGDDRTGVTIMQMDAGLDTGAMLRHRSLSIADTDTSATITTALADLGAAALLEVLQEEPWPAGEKQDEALATYAHKINKKDGWIEWSWSASDIVNRIRALQPWPVVQVMFRDTVWRLWSAVVLQQSHNVEPGRILLANSDGIDVACGHDTVLRIQELQRAGGRRINAKDFCNGHIELEGDRLLSLSMGVS